MWDIFLLAGICEGDQEQGLLQEISGQIQEEER